MVDDTWSSPKPMYMFPNSDFESWAVGMTITQDGNTIFFLGINPENQVDRASPDIYTSKKIKGK